MRNCIVAQSGGPTAVINASAVGVFDENLKTNYYDNVYAGLNGIEGILMGNLINLSELPYEKMEILKHTPSSVLGSCRYKMHDHKKDDSEYKKLIELFDSLDIKSFFYIGGNDSMDTVRKLSEYVENNNIDLKVIGIPKTIDNDLMGTDHTPGFGSAAKFIATTALECYLDSSVYTNNGIFIMETMGRDTGWLTASASLALIENKNAADLIYLPEVPFSIDKFLNDVRRIYNEKNQVFIVVSEGIRDEKGNFLCQLNSSEVHDKFGHAQLGGVCRNLKYLIETAGICSRVKTLELGVLQRCSMHCASKTDIDEAHSVGRAAVKYSIEGHSGYVVGIKRLSNFPYKFETELINPNDVANKTKFFPDEWINNEGNYVTKEAIDYIQPLVNGNPNFIYDNGLPVFTTLKG